MKISGITGNGERRGALRIKTANSKGVLTPTENQKPDRSFLADG